MSTVTTTASFSGRNKLVSFAATGLLVYYGYWIVGPKQDRRERLFTYKLRAYTNTVTGYRQPLLESYVLSSEHAAKQGLTEEEMSRL